MITLNQVSKSFGKTRVLESVDFTIQKGKVISLLGPNGSGKSTLIKCVLNLVHPNGGEILIDGIRSTDELSRHKISYMPQVAKFAENITAMHLFGLIARLRNSQCKPDQLVEYFEMQAHVNKPLGDLSGGSRQKVSAILAFMFDSPVIVLDEPTVGLDPISRVKFKQLVLEEKEKGKTIFFTSHIMSDVEEVADEIAFLLEGKIIYRGDPQTLLLETGQATLEKAIATFLKNNRQP